MITELALNRQGGNTVFAAGNKPVVTMESDCIMIEWKPEIPQTNVRNAKTSGNDIESDQNVKSNPHRNGEIKKGGFCPLPAGCSTRQCTR